MKSLNTVFEMARMTKAMIKNEKDELLYRAQSFKEKAGRLRRAGRTEESQRALEESERYKQLAAEWKPKEEFEERTVPYFKYYWTRYYLLSGGKTSHGASVEGCLREIFTEKVDFFNDYAGRVDFKPYLGVFKDGCVLPKRTEHWSPIANLSNAMDECVRLKRHDVMYEYDKIKDVVIEVRKDNECLWRYKGETSWRTTPTVKDFKFSL